MKSPYRIVKSNLYGVFFCFLADKKLAEHMFVIYNKEKSNISLFWRESI